jgi:hypothetical protein
LKTFLKIDYLASLATGFFCLFEEWIRVANCTVGIVDSKLEELDSKFVKVDSKCGEVAVNFEKWIVFEGFY